MYYVYHVFYKNLIFNLVFYISKLINNIEEEEDGKYEI